MVNKVTPDTMLSASRLPSVMGLSKYRAPNDELEYSIHAIKGLEREDIGNEAMAWGNQLEPLILKEAAERLQLTDLVTEHPDACFHPELPLCCSLDGTGDGRGQIVTTNPDEGIYVIGQDSIVLDGVGVLEAKLTGMDVEEIPPLWRGPIQLQAQMDIVQAKWGAIATLYRGIELRIFVFAPHQATVQKISEVTTDFQARLDKFRETGEVDYYAPHEGEKWPARRGEFPIEEEAIELDSSAERLAGQIIDRKRQVKDLEAKIEEDEQELKKVMGKAALGRAGMFQISWPTRHFKAQPQKIVPAKDAYTIRQSTLTIKEVKA